VMRFERAVAHLPQAELYLKPYILAIRAALGGSEAEHSTAVNEDYVRRVVQFRDLGATSALGEVLAASGNSRLAEYLYECLLPHREHCGHWGLLGIRWSGPVARPLALLAEARGQPAQADEHFGEALRIARRMGARPWVARISVEWVQALQRRAAASDRAQATTLLADARTLSQELGMRGLERRMTALEGAAPAATPAPKQPPRGVPTVTYFSLRRDGEVWVGECEGQSFRLKDSRGLQILARLLAAPGEDIHVLDLIGATTEGAVDSGDAGELLDERARRQYRQRLTELREELDEAEGCNDLARAESIRQEMEQLAGELSRAFGLGGRSRRAGSAIERARVNVQRRLKHAVERIARECPAAGRHLEWAIRTGLFCSYRPQ
ncbi:MAG TPA: hypothetical protein VF193_14975, partial [Steroidobacter sp.]